MTDEPPPPNPTLADDGPPPDRRADADPADPATIAELRSLAAVRDLVAGLSRPAAPDLSLAVPRRIAARRRRRTIARAAVAATLLAGVATAYSVGRARPSRPVAATPAAVVVVAPAPVAAPTAVEPTPPAPTDVAREFVGPPDDRPAIARLLMERTGPVRLFLAAGARSADVAEVAALVRLSSRRDFHRLDLPADGDRPAATVFAAELDPAELRTLRMRLADALPDGIRERETGPPLLADVARAATATTLRGAPAAEILASRHELAIRSPALDPPPPPDPVPDADPTPPDPASDAPDGPATVLVWIPDGG